MTSHWQVHQDDVGHIVLDRHQGSLCRLGLEDPVAVVFEVGLQDQPDGGVVLDDERCLHHGKHGLLPLPLASGRRDLSDTIATLLAGQCDIPHRFPSYCRGLVDG